MAVTDVLTDRETITGVSIRRAIETGDPAAVGDGVANDGLALQRFMSSLLIPDAETALVPRGTYKISTSLTFTHFIRFASGAVFSVDAGVTLTLAAGFDAPMRQIFAGAGTVVFAPGTVAEAVPQWWGAVGNGVANDAAPFNAALASLTASGGGKLKVPSVLQSGVMTAAYLIDTVAPVVDNNDSAGIVIPGDNIDIEGVGAGSRIACGPAFDGTANNANFLVSVRGRVVAPLVGAKNISIRRLAFVGRGTANTKPGGIHASPWTSNVVVEDCDFYSFGPNGASDHSSSYEGAIRNNRFYGCATGAMVSGSDITFGVNVEGNIGINTHNVVYVQGGRDCRVSGNICRYTSSYALPAGAEAGYLVANAIRVTFQRGTRVLGNIVDAVDSPVELPVGIMIGSDDVGAATYGHPRNLDVVDNRVSGKVGRAVRLKGASGCTVRGNSIGSTFAGEAQPFVGIELHANTGAGTKTTACTIEQNTIHVQPASGYGINGANGAEQGNVVRRNRLMSGAVRVELATDIPAADRSVAYENIGFVTEAKGVAAILAGNTSVVVTHGLSVTPAKEGFKGLVLTNSGNLAVKFSVTGFTSTTFTINALSSTGAAIDPTLSGAELSWEYSHARP